jgi:phenylacetate-CoA ligase
VPPGHGKPGQVKSSGSTGEPVVVKATDVVALFFHATNHMEVEWHQRNRKLKMAAVRAGQTPTGTHPNWGLPHSALNETGPCLFVNNNTDVKEQARLIYEFHTEILSCYPNVMDALMDAWQESGNKPSLKHYKSLGETASDAFRARVERIMGVKVEDSYSSQELGTIANQCPESGLYHTMDFNLIVEVLDQNDQQVLPGEIGRVVVTDLHNYASPLIRYDTGDWAEMGMPCSCGRGLQTLRKILGRTRNLIKRADGSRYWPMVGMYDFDKLDFRIRRYQVIQNTDTDIEYKIQTDNPLSESQRTALVGIVQEALGPEFVIRINRQEHDFAPAANGKFEEFVCKIK